MKIDTRPWGKMWVLISTKRFWLKIIHVTKGNRTSEQFHMFRDELHLSFFKVKWISRFTTHRMTEGWYLELAFGQPREEDIIRKEDDYGRA